MTLRQSLARTVFVSLVLLAFSAAAAELPAAKSDVRDVTVTVTPLSIASDSKRWTFSIEFDTHSQKLNDDVAHTVTLTAADGRPLKPVSWEGAAPGGHHRKVIVHFAAPVPVPANVELRMHRTEETMARVFRFRLD